MVKKGVEQMNELQVKAIMDLKNKNEKYISEISELLIKMKKSYKKFDDFEKWFWRLMNDMEKAHSQIPFLPFSNAYCIKDNYFSIPTTPCLRDSLYGTINEEYSFLSEKYMKGLENEIEEKANKVREELSNYFELISELLNGIIASNSITKRLSGLENKAVELEKKKELLWYPKQLSKEEYSLKGNFVVPFCLENPQTTLPLHRRLIIEYEYIFKSKDLQLSVLESVKAILLYINEYLPFAELIPLKESSGIKITNVVSPKQIQLGSENKFDGEINIGNEGDLKDGN
jgi:hypothetical protein